MAHGLFSLLFCLRLLAEQGLHRRFTGAHPRRRPAELLWKNWEHCLNRTKVSRLVRPTSENSHWNLARLGYGFVVCTLSSLFPNLTLWQEFEEREAAEESVAKYNDGQFMGNRIRVEISKGGSRAMKPPGDPGACFKCGQMGHWARYANSVRQFYR